MPRWLRLLLDFFAGFFKGFTATRASRKTDVDAGAAQQAQEQREEDERQATMARVRAEELKDLSDDEIRRRADRWNNS